MFRRFVTADRSRLGALAGVGLTLWLSLFCHHCLAAAASLDQGTLPQQGAGIPAGDHHDRDTHHDCDGDCLQVYSLKQDVPAASGQAFLAATGPSVSALPAWAEPVVFAGPSACRARAFPPPAGASIHPLTLNCVQLK